MKRLKIKDIHNLKNKRKIVCLTSYTPSITKAIEKYVDILLIGDSLGSVIYNMDNTRSVTLNMMKNHGRVVMESSNFPYSIIDMPYKSYINKSSALKNALSLLKHTKCQAIKIEVSRKQIELVSYLSQKKIEVVSHIGVRPQSYSNFSKIKAVGKSEKEKNQLIDLALKLEDAGSKIILLECVYEKTASLITSRLKIPTIGIGSSVFCDGQILVIDDVLGLDTKFKPKFVKNYVRLSSIISNAVKKYAKDVKNKKFPNTKQTYK